MISGIVDTPFFFFQCFLLHLSRSDCISDGAADGLQHFFSCLTDCVSQMIKHSGCIKICDCAKIIFIQITGWVQSTAGQHHILNARRQEIAEGYFGALVIKLL
ncbi:MAG: hypothetical protein KHY90_10160 [Clostridium sp.]|nr:hypothetical protein [Clostridium sp.]